MMTMGKTVNLNRYDITPYEQAELEDILENGIDYKFNPKFNTSDSYKVLFKDAEEIPEPGTSWFLHAVHGDNYNPKSKKAKVLTAAQERLIFLQYNWCKYKVAQQVLTEDPDISTMIHFLRKKNIIREKIVGYNLALVLSLVKKAANSNLQFDELIGIGNWILIQALDKFDTGEGTKFSTYLTLSIPRAFGKESKKLSKYHEKFPVNIDPGNMNGSGHANEWLEAKTEEDEEPEKLQLEIMREVIAKNLAGLSEIEMKIIKRRYPADADAEFKKPTLETLGKEMKCSKSNLSRLEREALGKLNKTIMEILYPETKI